MLTLSEAIKRLSEIKQRGYVRSLRRGPTGIGKTLEELLGIKENNISSPDLGHIELKARRENHFGLTTLFTFNRKAWKMKPLDAIRKYGSPDKNGRLGLYYTMSRTPNSAGLFLLVEQDAISVRSVDGNLIALWELKEIERRFKKKVRSVLLVKAQVEERGGWEYFHFVRARLLSGGATQSILRDLFNSGKLLLDLRLHDKGTSARNHGTGFRVNMKDIESLYPLIQEFPL